jgi:hypothetical protein
VPITTNGMSSNSAHSEVYSIQYDVIKFVSDFSGFLVVIGTDYIGIYYSCRYTKYNQW